MSKIFSSIFGHSSSSGSGKENEENQSFSTGEEFLQDNPTQVQNAENVENNFAPKLEAILAEKEVTPDRYIHLSGLSSDTSGKDIKDFLVDCRIVENVVFIKQDDGTPHREAIVKLKDESELQKALKFNKKYLKSHYIVIKEATRNTYELHNQKPQEKETPPSTFAKLGSLVWSATVDDIENFLKGCNVMKVVIKKDERGRPTGNAFVQFESDIDIGIALKQNKKYLGKRWVTVEQIAEDEFILAKEEDQNPIPQNQETMSRHNDQPMEAETCITFVKLGSLSWSATEEDIKTFLTGCKIREVVIIENERGQSSGNAVVSLESKADVEKAKTYNRKYLGKRWVTVDEIREDEYNKEAKIKAAKKYKAYGTTVKLGSLSFKITEDDIELFFHDCNIKEIIITNNEKGKPSGDAFVLFESKEDVEKAKKYNKKYLGERWITVDEIRKDDYYRETEKYHKITSNTPDTPDNSGNSGFYLKLSSTPWGATTQEIHDFLKNCKVNKLLPLRNHLERIGGEVIIEVASEEDQTRALSLNKTKFMGKSVLMKKLNYGELTTFITQNLKETPDDEEESREALMSFCAKPETNVDESGETKDSNDTIGGGAVKKTTGDGAGDVAKESIQGEKEKQVKIYKFEIKPIDNVEDEEEVLEDCKDLELEGVIWEKGNIVPVSEGKSKIILDCTVKNNGSSAQFIKKSLEEIGSVEDVKIID